LEQGPRSVGRPAPVARIGDHGRFDAPERRILSVSITHAKLAAALGERGHEIAENCILKLQAK
jgi:hypothetical protein